ncbi:MAG: STAS domain-containing protein [Cocleimonas sp.]|nr:STAS domain-containing protein [Cocleimonas sp.]
MNVHETAYSTVVKLDAAVDAEVASELGDVLSNIESPINGRLILDLEVVSYISSDGICVLLNDCIKNSNSYRLEFRNVNKDVKQLLNTVGLGNLISI